MLQLDNVSKKIKRQNIIDNVSLSVEPGSFMGILGKTGSGKSMLLKLCAGLIKPDSGKLIIDGLDMSVKENSKKRYSLTGYMGENCGVYPRITVLEYLEIFAHAAGLYGLSARQRCMELLSFAQLERISEQFFDEQSISIKKLVYFLKTFIHSPKLLLLDDPFCAMAISQRIIMKEIMTNLFVEGTTIIMSSSSLSDAQELCHEICIIDKGSIIGKGPVEAVLSSIRSEAPLYIRVCNDADRAAAILRADEKVRSISIDGSYFMVHFNGNADDEAMLLSRLEAQKIRVYSFYRGESSFDLLMTDKADYRKKGR